MLRKTQSHLSARLGTFLEPKRQTGLLCTAVRKCGRAACKKERNHVNRQCNRRRNLRLSGGLGRLQNEAEPGIRSHEKQRNRNTGLLALCRQLYSSTNAVTRLDGRRKKRNCKDIDRTERAAIFRCDSRSKQNHKTYAAVQRTGLVQTVRKEEARRNPGYF